MNHQRKAQIANLATQYGRLVFQSAFRILSDNHLAEDVMQEVFLKLFKKPTTAFDAVRHWPSYLKTMAVSTAIDYLRRNTRLAEESLDNTPEPHTHQSEQPLQEMLKSLDLIKFQHALVQLTAQDAEIFCLRYIEGHSYQEIASLLDITDNYVGVCLHRTQKKLSSILGQSQFLGEKHAI